MSQSENSMNCSHFVIPRGVKGSGEFGLVFMSYELFCVPFLLCDVFVWCLINLNQISNNKYSHLLPNTATTNASHHSLCKWYNIPTQRNRHLSPQRSKAFTTHTMTISHLHHHHPLRVQQVAFSVAAWQNWTHQPTLDPIHRHIVHQRWAKDQAWCIIRADCDRRMKREFCIVEAIELNNNQMIDNPNS